KMIFKADPEAKKLPPPMPVPHHVRVPKGAVVGHLIAHYKYLDSETGKYEEGESIRQGDSIIVTTVSGKRLTPVYDTFICTDYFKSEMSEFDANTIFVPLEHLQVLRNMDDRGTNILIKLKNYDQADNVKKALYTLFDKQLHVNTWEEKQGPLL